MSIRENTNSIRPANSETAGVKDRQIVTSTLSGNHDIPNDQLTNQPTDGHWGYREVTLPKSEKVTKAFDEKELHRQKQILA